MGDVIRYRAGSDAALRAKLVEGAPLVQAAAAAGMSERTARRRWHDPAFRASVEALRSEVEADAVGQLVALYGEAIDTLHELLGSAQKPTVRQRSAELIMKIGPALRSESAMHARLAVVETQGAELRELQTAILTDRALNDPPRG